MLYKLFENLVVKMAASMQGDVVWEMLYPLRKNIIYLKGS